MRLLYAPLVSDKELRIEAARVCWWRKGSRKEGKEAEHLVAPGGKTCSDSRGGILAQLMVATLIMVVRLFPSFGYGRQCQDQGAK